MKYNILLKDLKQKNIYNLGEDFQGINPEGIAIDFTNYYMQINNTPFFGISGEFHFSRGDQTRWEDEIIKMKMCGVNVISTYIFWIHHEEEEGIFDFRESKNLRHFVELCEKHGIYVVVRIGPFDHGEVRNGGIPDWMYGKPFDVRKLNEGFLYYTKRLYKKIAEQIEGLYYKDGGPIIATQIDNEYMHSSAPWEITTGISNEWVFGGDDREEYMLTLKEEAKKCGIITPFYTCTGWGGAITPTSMMPLWGGYAFRPWLFYSNRGEHPSTAEYVYQDFHKDNAEVTSDFKPAYLPETRPYACCEMGGGMTCTYNYRFVFSFKSVDAMSNIKIASGCNFLGYYVFQGGTNPKGKHGTFMNESQVPKISYDYQAALGEFGQIRESYSRLKSLHFFCQTFGKELCKMQTVLPMGASQIEAKDLETLRFAVRTDGKKGFLFINNFQDHETITPKEKETIGIQMEEEILFENISLAAEENCILPFGMDLDGIELNKATAQPITRIEKVNQITYVFLKPEGMESEFFFEDGAKTEQGSCFWKCDKEEVELFFVEKGNKKINILCLKREKANQMFILKDQTLLFSDGAILEDEKGIRMETSKNEFSFSTYPKESFNAKLGMKEESDIFDQWNVQERNITLSPEITKVGESRYTVTLLKNFMKGLKDVIMKISYQGDIAHAFIDSDMIHDNFCNGEEWEIGLKTFEQRLEMNPMTIAITPLKEGVNVNVESAMAARMENADAYIGNLESVKLCPIYEFWLSEKGGF